MGLIAKFPQTLLVKKSARELHLKVTIASAVDREGLA
jgi:hypothetical protein